ncbi:MAG: queuosine precursor transporter [Lachnospiraceae bacterium]|nr:queuosine precursor transporter [Lachnospiraceae bacterium]
MRNEILLIGSVLLIYGMVLIAYKLFGKNGLFAMTVLATVFANIEVLILIEGFGMSQTLGNVMFASTYLITDILSENEGKEYAARAVWLGVFTSVAMLLFTQYFLLYTPAEADWVTPHLRAIFSTTPRMLLASFTGYVISQRFDVWLYHRFWEFTTQKTGDKKRLLWLRNNGATLISQVLNTALFTLIAFAGWYDGETLLSVMLSSYVVYIFTSLLDTPAVYLGRWMKFNGMIPES